MPKRPIRPSTPLAEPPGSTPDGSQSADRSRRTTKTVRPVGLITAEDRATWKRWADEQAQDSFHRGESCWRDGNTLDALAWLERAHRMAPSSPNLSFLLAVVRQAAGLQTEAVNLLRSLTARFDFRAGWTLLAAMLLSEKRPLEAAAAMGRALSGHACDEETATLAERCVGAANLEGWCGLDSDGALRIGGPLVRELTRAKRPATKGRPPKTSGTPLSAVEVRIDGRTLPTVLKNGRLTWPKGLSVLDESSRIEIIYNDRPLMGSPIDAAAIGRTDGLVQAGKDGLEGWAWHPQNPDRPPELRILDATDNSHLATFTADLPSDDVSSDIPLARYRAIAVPWSALPDRMVRVVGSQGRDLSGSPLDPGLERRAARWAAQCAALSPTDCVVTEAGTPALPPPFLPIPVDTIGTLASRQMVEPANALLVIIPVYRNAPVIRACIDSVLTTLPSPSRNARGHTRVLIVDDASPEPEVAALLANYAADSRVSVQRNTTNLGFAASVNIGLRAALDAAPSAGPPRKIVRKAALPAANDVILLNSDTLVPEGWIERLRDVAYGASDIGTVTPLSNDATILSYPDPNANAVPSLEQTHWLAKLCRQANGSTVVDLPTAHGFCMYIRHDCLRDVGLFRDDLFAQGYGEENNFSLRARALGWRNVVAAGAFVAHVGSASFGATRTALLERNLGLLKRLHPGYDELVGRFLDTDPLFEVRRRIDLLRWRRGWSTEMPRGTGTGKADRQSVVFITHDQGGGVERVVRDRANRLRERGIRPIILRPVEGGCRIDGWTEDDRTVGTTAQERTGPASSVKSADVSTGLYPNLRFRLPEEWSGLQTLLASAGVRHVEWHHGNGHVVSITDIAEQLGVPQDIFVHDYIWFCPRISLVGPLGHYCGEPDIEGCERCVSLMTRDDPPAETVADRVKRSAAQLAAARHIIAPSTDAAARMERHFPGIRVQIMAPEIDTPSAPISRAATPIPPGIVGLPRTERARICVVGAIGREKGYDVILEAARDAQRHALPLEFVIVGHTPDDTRLIETGHAYVTGAYHEDEAVSLVRAQNADYGFIPSVWPETWCLALGVAWRAGLDVAAFDLGAVAERIRATGSGSILPLGVSASRLNMILTSLCQRHRTALTG